MQNPSRASVFEEFIHAAQYRNEENDGSYVSRLKCEIAAQKKLLKHSSAYKLTDAEIGQTKTALTVYENELNDYLKSEEEIIRTLVHESVHVKQYKKYGTAYVQNNMQIFEEEAYSIENEFIEQLKKEGKL